MLINGGYIRAGLCPAERMLMKFSSFCFTFIAYLSIGKAGDIFDRLDGELSTQFLVCFRCYLLSKRSAKQICYKIDFLDEHYTKLHNFIRIVFF